MIIVTEKAEEKLIESLDIQETQNDDRRCVYLKASNLEDFDLDESLEFIYKNIDDQDSAIFICEDKDIFITARCLGTPFTKIIAQFLLPTPTTQPAQNSELAVLFEMRVDRLKIIKIVEGKLRIKQNRENEDAQKQEKNKHNQTRQAILGQPIAQNLIDTLAQRRNDREETEILIVEDDLFSQKLIVNSLPDTFNISLSKDGQNALSQYFIRAPDILFLDIGLPDIDGHDVLEKILEHDPHAFIVMLSGKGDKDNITKAIKNGAKGFVGKPFTREKLFQYIEKSPHIQNL